MSPTSYHCSTPRRNYFQYSPLPPGCQGLKPVPALFYNACKDMSQIIAGRNPVIEALKAGRPISRILLSRDIKSQSLVDEIMRLSRARSVPVEFVARQAVDRHSAPGDSQGVVA